MAIERKNEILVGGFILAGLGLFILLLSLMGTLGRIFEPTRNLQMVFSDIRGLKTGDPVSFLGSKVGLVKEVEFSRRNWGQEYPEIFPGDTREMTRVVISAEIPRRVYKHLRTDTPVVIDKTLTGNLTVLIQEGEGEPLPEEDAILRGSPGVDLNSMTGRFDRMLETMEPAIQDIAALTSRLADSQNLEKALEEVAALTRELHKGIGPIQEMLQAALEQAHSILSENREDIRTVAANLAKGSELARRVLEKVEPASSKLDSALAQVEKAGSEVARTIKDNRPRIDGIIEDARSAIANASNLTADIRRRPWRLLYRPSESEAETLDIYDAAWAYNLGASDLERCLNSLAIQISSDPAGSRDPEKLRTAYLQVEESLRRHKKAEDAFWTCLQDR